MNLTLINSLSALSGLVTTGTGLIIVIVGGFFLIKSGVGKTVAKANQDAIVALQATILALQTDLSNMNRKVDEITKDKARLELTIDTMCTALKSRGLLITIQGDLINVDTLDGKSSTVTRIHGNQNGQ